MSAWQEIETAPRDGTDVLLLIDGRPPVVAGWYHDEWQKWDDGSPPLGEPTHWFPIPEPPEAQS